jgi:hypothetical protein
MVPSFYDWPLGFLVGMEAVEVFVTVGGSISDTAEDGVCRLQDIMG